MRAALAAILLAGCAAAPTMSPSVAPFPADSAFIIDGRLSVRRDREAATANFTWRHAPPRDELTVSTPLGQALAEISGDRDSGRYVLVGADGRSEEAADWSALTGRALGAPLPVEGLAFWIGGAPRPNAPHSLEPDAAGRPAVLRQDGWEIVYAYVDDSAQRPARLSMTRADLEIRIAVLARR